MTEKPMLTISLLCSGREGTKRCLDSLETLRKRVLSELILVDTGCDEKMRRLLFSYADEVVSFAWCDDFSKARNAGLEKAHGEWFLYLDDDESFVDTEAIEDFFLSGAYRNFGYAAYTVRNFFDEELKNYQDTLVVRLYSLKNGGKFQGAVHEDFVPIQKPVKTLNSIAEHTGYIYRTPEDKVKHSVRNVTLLKKAVAEENDDIDDAGNMMRLRAHLASEYLELKDYEKLAEFCDETLQKFETLDNREGNRHRGCFYCGKILAEIFLEEYETAYQTYTKAVSDKRNTEYTMAYLMTQGAELFWQRGEKERAAKCCKRYLELWEYYKKRPEKRLAEQTFFVITAFYDETKSRMYCYQICFDLEKEDTSSLKSCFDLLGWEKDIVYMTEDFMPCLVKAMVILPKEDIFVHVVDVLANKSGMDNFWKEVEKIKGEEKLRKIIRIFSEMTQGAIGMAANLKKMLAAEERDDWNSFSVHLKKAVEICPSLGEVLKRYARFYAGHRGERAELQTLAEQVKDRIRVLLRQGMLQEAAEVSEQLKRLLPEDKELEELMRGKIL